jgi:hypothetical protein
MPISTLPNSPTITPSQQQQTPQSSTNNNNNHSTPQQPPTQNKIPSFLRQLRWGPPPPGLIISSYPPNNNNNNPQPTKSYFTTTITTNRRTIIICFITISILLLLLFTLSLISSTTHKWQSLHSFLQTFYSSGSSSSRSKKNILQSTCTIITATSPRALHHACQSIKDTIPYDDLSSLVNIFTNNNNNNNEYPTTTWCIINGPIDLRLLSHNNNDNNNIPCNLKIYIEDGRDAAFDYEFYQSMAWSSHVQLESEMETEDWIDEICYVRRLRIGKGNGFCSIKEIPILRSFRKWFLLTQQVLQFNHFMMEGNNVEIITIPFAKRGIGHVLNHRELMRDLTSIVKHLFLDEDFHVIIMKEEEEDNIELLPEIPKEIPIDAGTCTIVAVSDSSNKKNHGGGGSGSGATTIPYAHCLPSFLIIGAQKAGTDELAVWLNFNPYHRRMDGGPETHFFDCIGRGRGQDREPCKRGRSYQMSYSQSAPGIAILSINSTNTKYWSWEKLRKQARHNRVDELWQRYARIGQLDRNSYYKTPSRTLIFEKSPSYSDLADVRDIVRLLPSVKLIFLTRDPVARLFSSYWQFCKDTGFSKNNHVKCSVEHYEELVIQLTTTTHYHGGGGGSSSSNNIDPTFLRSAEHGLYAKYLRTWCKYFNWRKNQILILDAHEFHYLPQGVIYAIESFVGNRGSTRHHTYKPQWKDGYWVLGDYSKANHPSTSNSNRQPNTTIVELLKQWYKPSILEYIDLLKEYDGNVIVRGIVGENLPIEIRNQHPTLFETTNKNNFILPPWVREYISSG